MNTLSAMEVIERFQGRLSYRMLDYYLRTGAIVIQNDSRGSGHHRRFTLAEVEAIGDMIDALEDLRRQEEAISTGKLFRERLRYRSNPMLVSQ